MQRSLARQIHKALLAEFISHFEKYCLVSLPRVRLLSCNLGIFLIGHKIVQLAEFHKRVSLTGILAIQSDACIYYPFWMEVPKKYFLLRDLRTRPRPWEPFSLQKLQ